jgi:CheY-like chemotaxis protein
MRPRRRITSNQKPATTCDAARALDAGFADFLRKPLEPAQLALAVSAAVR